MSVEPDLAGLDTARPLRVTTPRGTFACLEFGEPGAPLVLLIHGFPDTPHGLAPIAPYLTGAGLRVVAPFLRGYAPSPLAGPFDLDTLADDARALAEALSPGERPAIVGHDWGAAITYGALHRHPGYFRAAVTMAVPHPIAFLSSLASQPAQLRRSLYMLFFQLPMAPETLARRDPLSLVDRLWRAWSPGLEPPRAHLGRVARCLGESLPGPLELYRAMARPPVEALARVRAAAREPIREPLLYLQGQQDGCIGPEASRGQERHFTGRFHQEVIDGAGHFLAIERPFEVGPLAASWLTRSG